MISSDTQHPAIQPIAVNQPPHNGARRGRLRPRAPLFAVSHRWHLRFALLVVGCWMLVVGCSFGSWISFSHTNAIGGTPMTNSFTVRAIGNPAVDANGNVTAAIGLPIRITPAADGRATNQLQAQNYFVTNTPGDYPFLNKGYVFRAPLDSGPTVYPAAGPGQLISGLNYFVTLIITNGEGGGGSVTFNNITNALGFLPLTPGATNDLATALIARLNTIGGNGTNYTTTATNDLASLFETRLGLRAGGLTNLIQAFGAGGSNYVVDTRRELTNSLAQTNGLIEARLVNSSNALAGKIIISTNDSATVFIARDAIVLATAMNASNVVKNFSTTNEVDTARLTGAYIAAISGNIRDTTNYAGSNIVGAVPLATLALSGWPDYGITNQLSYSSLTNQIQRSNTVYLAADSALASRIIATNDAITFQRLNDKTNTLNNATNIAFTAAQQATNGLNTSQYVTGSTFLNAVTNGNFSPVLIDSHLTVSGDLSLSGDLLSGSLDDQIAVATNDTAVVFIARDSALLANVTNRIERTNTVVINRIISSTNDSASVFIARDDANYLSLTNQIERTNTVVINRIISSTNDSASVFIARIVVATNDSAVVFIARDAAVRSDLTNQLGNTNAVIYSYITNTIVVTSNSLISKIQATNLVVNAITNVIVNQDGRGTNTTLVTARSIGVTNLSLFGTVKVNSNALSDVSVLYFRRGLYHIPLEDGSTETYNLGFILGQSNDINQINSGYASSIISGESNRIYGWYQGGYVRDSVIVGGASNIIWQNGGFATPVLRAVIIGGNSNVINGGVAGDPLRNSVIVGGTRNRIDDSDNSVAMGWGANILSGHDEVFMFSDGNDTPFMSSSNKQFLVRARNGIGFNKTNPAAGTFTVGQPFRTVLETNLEIVSGSIKPWGNPLISYNTTRLAIRGGGTTAANGTYDLLSASFWTNLNTTACAFESGGTLFVLNSSLQTLYTVSISTLPTTNVSLGANGSYPVPSIAYGVDIDLSGTYGVGFINWTNLNTRIQSITNNALTFILTNVTVELTNHIYFTNGLPMKIIQAP